MGLTKYRLGDLIQIIDERNKYGIKTFYGINIDKQFMPTVANTEGLNECNYKVVRKNRFVFSGMQTGRDKCIRISLYSKDKPIIVSPAYITFEIKETDIVLPSYFFMLFRSKEKDRLGWFYSDSSIRSNLDWDRFCDIELNLPDISIQQKYVAVYNAMLADQQSYERGLEDLKLVCDGFIDNLRETVPLQKLGNYISLSDRTNSDLACSIEDVKGISIEKKFIDTKANMDGVSLSPYAIVEPNEFAYVSVTSRNGGRISLARNDSKQAYICSSSYVVFRINDPGELLPEYMSMLFERGEFYRYARFHSWGSARETFEWDEMQSVEIPVPDVKIQQDIVDIFKAYHTRKDIAEKLKTQIQNICPILIKGSIEEAQKIDEA